MAKLINIRPTTSVYATYKNINYDIWNAIAEFVDNSTQSFYDNRDKLEDTKYWKGLNVEISYEKDEHGDYYLEIKDNAFGMDFHDFKRAIILDSKPKFDGGRSEFGMGLKTAACWFGSKWSVESTMLGSTIKYKTTVDVIHLSTYKDETIEVVEEQSRRSDHGTTIRIWDLHRTIRGRQVSKVKKTLSGIYRKDITSGCINLYYNCELLEYNYPSIYTEKNNEDEIIKWEKEINMDIDFEGKTYHVGGFIAIREVGSVQEAGFSLFRYGRAIIGGYENNYRPKEIFGDSNSYVYQRLFGDLILNDWPVVQTKDNFYWNNGLEDKFIDALKVETQDFVKKSLAIRKRSTKKPKEISIEVQDVLKKVPYIEEFITADNKEIRPEVPRKDENESENNIIEENVGDIENYDVDNSDSEIRYGFKFKGRTYIFNILLQFNNSSSNWLDIYSKSSSEYDVHWNIKHPFFESLSINNDFINVFTKIIFAFTLGEVIAMQSSSEGNFKPSDIRTFINTALKEGIEVK